MSDTPLKPRLVRCPACGGDSLYATENPFRPFCSPRCKNMDFGAWASEAYRVESRPGPEDLPEDLGPEPGDAGRAARGPRSH
ncbi:DNA gyrase inhibitor YacG [Caldimonas tepidiphila]|uniref:DNA gyrase inhibitor YacG n=1 Tax=Caldimonas tepidiphila TaxID=2315841 RepID=UPI000E5B20FB|nr:DNA gyrase inhibitor YacG [Caldimonas tepidiphila]